MGGSTTSYGYCIRFTVEEDIEAHKWFDKVVCSARVHERGRAKTPNPHWHYILIFSEPKSHNDVNKVLKERGYEGNKMKSVKRWNGNDVALQYMYKEYVGKEYAEQAVMYTGTKPMDWKSPKEYLLKCQAYKEAVKSQKVLRDNAYEECLKEILNQFNSKTEITEIIDYYLNFYKKNKLKLKNEMHIYTDINNIMFRLENKKFIEALKSRIYQRCS